MIYAIAIIAIIFAFKNPETPKLPAPTKVVEQNISKTASIPSENTQPSEAEYIPLPVKVSHVKASNLAIASSSAIADPDAASALHKVEDIKVSSKDSWRKSSLEGLYYINFQENSAYIDEAQLTLIKQLSYIMKNKADHILEVQVEAPILRTNTVALSSSRVFETKRQMLKWVSQDQIFVNPKIKKGEHDAVVIKLRPKWQAK